LQLGCDMYPGPDWLGREQIAFLAVGLAKVIKARTLVQISILSIAESAVFTSRSRRCAERLSKQAIQLTERPDHGREPVTMKKNMVPLLGIAFVVAIISTGVFYGLFAGKLRSSNELPGHAIVVAARDLERGTVIQPSDLRVSQVPGVVAGAFSKPEDAAGATLLTALKTNEPVLDERVAPRDSQGAGGRAVPAGMRAVTLHVFQSESLLAMLQPGSRVDLQAVSDKNGAAELRTVLENVQILVVSPPDPGGNRSPSAAVTALIRAQDTDMVALADAGSRIRLALRNPLDEKTTLHRPLALGEVFSVSSKLQQDTAEPAHTNRGR